MRDEPGPGGVRVGATRTDLDCRVVATSRRVAPTECDSILPLFGRDSTCRLRLLGSWPPRAEAVVFDSSRGSTRVSRLVAPTESDSSDIRHTWGVAQLVRLVRLCRTLSDEDVTAHATRKTCPRSKVHLKSTRLVDSSDSSVRSSDSVGQRCHGTRETRLVRHAPARKSARQRLVDSSDSSLACK